MPPLLAAQVQIHAAEPSSVTAEAAPTLHRLAEGAALTVVPLAEPHTPSTGGPPDELPLELPDELLPEDEPLPDELLLEPEDELDELARLAPQSDAVPPPLPWQIQVQGPAPETGDAVPELHRLVAGAALTVVLLAGPHVPFTAAAFSVAAHCAVVPPFVPAQFQLNGPLPLTLDAVPVVHRLAAGAVLTLCPFDEPHAPFTACACRLAAHCAVPPPLLPTQLHAHGPLPLMFDAMPALQRLVAGALLAATPLAAPHAPLAAWIVASHPAVVPPPAPAQLHSHGPLPAIVDAVPAAHRFEEGALLSTCPFDEPQAPLTGVTVPLLDEVVPELELVVPLLDVPPPELELLEPVVPELEPVMPLLEVLPPELEPVVPELELVEPELVVPELEPPVPLLDVLPLDELELVAPELEPVMPPLDVPAPELDDELPELPW